MFQKHTFKAPVSLCKLGINSWKWNSAVQSNIIWSTAVYALQ